MNGIQMNYNLYNQRIKSMESPVSAKDLPKVKLDARGAIRYAKSIGKHVYELSDEEKQRFATPYK